MSKKESMSKACEKFLKWKEGLKDKQNDYDKMLMEELGKIEKSDNKDELIYEAFYKELEFGTGGLRGILGAGTNRVNIYTIAKATAGLSKYVLSGEYLKDSPLKRKGAAERLSVAIAYDSRINSMIFAMISAKVLSMYGIHAYVYNELMPTPALSFAVRHLDCAMGIMITASHNPAKYNGYKVYDNSGCQITQEAAKKIYESIQKISEDEQKRIGMQLGDAAGEYDFSGENIEIIGEPVKNAYIEAVLRQSTNADSGKKTDNLLIVYTPLNGAGNKPVKKMLREIGVKKLHIIAEQEMPDGNFPTCPYPNPEKAEAMKLGLQYCEKLAAKAMEKAVKEDVPDLLIATDPDCDRVGIAVRKHLGKDAEYVLMTGNEIGVMLLAYIIEKRVKTNKVLDPVVITTIVSTKMAEAVAKAHEIQIMHTLTGFKYIGEQIGIMENRERENNFLFGFEESHGYLSGAYVRDKDAVNGAMLIAELASECKENGITLYEYMESLYEKYGYYKDKVIDFTFEGAKGMATMIKIMHAFRTGLPEQFAGQKPVIVEDYTAKERTVLETGESLRIELPKSDVVSVIFHDCRFTVRPSGTEPKLKIYMSAKGETKKEAEKTVKLMEQELTRFVELHR